MRIAVLVTTMHRTDFSLYKKMNLHTDAVIANQTDRNEITERSIEGNNVRLVSTDFRGVSRNRNIALAHYKQEEDIVVFADDDLVFNDGYDELINAEFESHPEAEAIKFNLHDLSDTRKISMKKIERFEKATRRNMSASGVWGVAIKTKALKRINVRFDERFGPGADFINGEDTIFLMNMIDRGIAFYRSPVDIAGIDQTDSSWFTGHNEEYYKTAGAVIDTIYPAISGVLILRSAYRSFRRQECEMGYFELLSNYFKGVKENRKRK